MKLHDKCLQPLWKQYEVKHSLIRKQESWNVRRPPYTTFLKFWKYLAQNEKFGWVWEHILVIHHFGVNFLSVHYLCFRTWITCTRISVPAASCKRFRLDKSAAWTNGYKKEFINARSSSFVTVMIYLDFLKN